MDETPSVAIEYGGAEAEAFRLLDALPASELEGDVDMDAAEDIFTPFDFFGPVRMLGSFVIS
jgi:hypothetical protein